MNSQNNEEQIILDYFKENGVFLDIGANDGKTLSNTYALAERGWSGVCVEPSPMAFQGLSILYKNNKNVFCYNYAIGTTNAKDVPFFESGKLLSETDYGLVSTLHESEKKRFQASVSYQETKVQMFRWKTFLNRLKFKTFDFISIDTEGSDYDILTQIDLTHTKMVCVEWNSVPANKDLFVNHMQGFRLISVNPENLIFAR